jgi:hypothetical protein
MTKKMASVLSEISPPFLILRHSTFQPTFQILRLKFWPPSACQVPILANELQDRFIKLFVFCGSQQKAHV